MPLAHSPTSRMSASIMKPLAYLLLVLMASSASSAQLQITLADRLGNLTWVNALTNGVTTLESSKSLAGPWAPLINNYIEGPQDHAVIPMSTSNHFVRARQVHLDGTAEGLGNLLNSYGLLTTIAGSGDAGADTVNYWSPASEGGLATSAPLSRPHMSAADALGNIYIVDKDSHAVLKVTPDGHIHTWAGTHVAGMNGDGPALATTLQLSSPNGLVVHPNGTVFVLDTGNGKVRRINTNGLMDTIFTTKTAVIKSGRGLWVKSDVSLIYYRDGKDVRKWTPKKGDSSFATGFNDLGNFDLDVNGELVVTDRGANLVQRIPKTGIPVTIAGNGLTTGGGDGAPALSTGLSGVRGICFLPNNGYLLATDEGSQIWYVDPSGIIHLFLDGVRSIGGNFPHGGDGQYFRAPGYKMSQGRSVTLAPNGDILVTESDAGYVRRIRFMPFPYN